MWWALLWGVVVGSGAGGIAGLLAFALSIFWQESSRLERALEELAKAKRITDEENEILRKRGEAPQREAAEHLY